MRQLFSRPVGTVAAAAVLLVTAGSAGAQVVVSSKAMELRIDGRLHFQYNQTSAEGAQLSNTFFVRRARLEVEARINDFVSGRIQPEFGEGTVGLRDAFVTLNFGPALRTTFGQFKRPFDVFELTSSSQILVIERAGGVRGIPGCAAASARSAASPRGSATRTATSASWSTAGWARAA